MVRTGAFVFALLVTLLFPGGQALADHAPDHVTVTNVNDVSFSVTWITASAVTGQVEWATNAANLPGSGSTVNDERGGATSDDTHSVAIGGLVQSTTYFFDVLSGGVRDDNGGAHYQVTTGLTLGPAPTGSAFGEVKRQDASGAVGCLVYFKIVRGGSESGLLSAPVLDLGSNNIFYDAAIGGARVPPGFNSYFNPISTDTVDISAQCADDGVGSVTTDYATATAVPPDVNVAPLPTWSIADQSFDEGVGGAVVEIVLSQTSGVDETVSFATTQGTAKSSAPGQDYGNSEVAGTVTVTAGATSTTTTIPIIDDSLDEPSEGFTITLSNPTGSGDATIGDGTGTITITDNDLPPDVFMGDAFVPLPEGNAPLTSTASVSVFLSAVSGLDVSVDYNTSDGTATDANNDYEPASGTLTIPADNASGTFTVTINGDDTFEADETFTVTLSNATSSGVGAQIVTQTTTVVTIANDDKPVTLVDTGETTDEDSAFTSTASVLANDPSDGVSGVTLTAVNFSTPAKGVLTPQSDGTYQYNPNGEFESLALSQSDTVTFTYQAQYAGLLTTLSDPTTSIINIDGVNDAPVALNDFVAVLPGEPKPVSAPGVLANDSDVDTGDTFTAILVSGIPANQGTLSVALQTDGSFTYDPGSFVGTTSFTYKANDGALDSNVATVTLSQGPTFAMTLDTTSVDEDASTVTATIVLINPTTTAASTVEFSTVAGTAVANVDYATVSRTGATAVTLTATNTSTDIVVTILNDAADPIREGPEQFDIQLSNASANSVIAGSTGGILTVTVTIDDQADLPTLSVADVTAPEGASVSTADFVVTLSGKTNFTSTVSFATADNTSTDAALAGTDYQSAATTVTFGPNTATGLTTAARQTTQTVSVTILEDDIDEFDETFDADLSGGQESGSALTLSITDDLGVGTIVDNDLAPVLAISDPAPIVEGGLSTVTVTLTGASSRGVTVDAGPVVGGTATPGAGEDYISSTLALSWSADESGDKTFDVGTNGDAEEEDAESVILKLRNASSDGAEGVILVETTGRSAVRPDGVQADATAVLQINDDEPAVKVVTITSEGEAMPGDQYFVVIAGTPSNTTGLTPIANVPEILQKMHGLGEVRSKSADYVMLAEVASTTPPGMTILTYTIGGPVTTTLKVVSARSNRNFFLSPGTNFTGLALVPDDPSITNLLDQTVPNAYPGLVAAIKALDPDNVKLDRDIVTLADVVQTVSAFDGTWNSYNTANPISGADPADTLTDLAPFQGMLIRTRETVDVSSPGDTNVFAMADAPGFLSMQPVPVKMTIGGPFIEIDPSDPVEPPVTTLRVGFNLLALHVSDATPFDTVFGGSGSDLRALYSSAISFERSVIATSDGGGGIGALIIARPITEAPSILFSVPPGVIVPELSYWIRVAETTPQVIPTLTASGPSSGGFDPFGLGGP